MKTRLFGILLAAILVVPAMTGCQAVRTVKAAGRAMEHGTWRIACRRYVKAGDRFDEGNCGRPLCKSCADFGRSAEHRVQTCRIYCRSGDGIAHGI